MQSSFWSHKFDAQVGPHCAVDSLGRKVFQGTQDTDTAKYRALHPTLRFGALDFQDILEYPVLQGTQGDDNPRYSTLYPAVR